MLRALTQCRQHLLFETVAVRLPMGHGRKPSRRQLQQDTFDVLQPPVVIASTQAAHIALEIILIAQQAVKTSSKQTQLARQMAHGMNGGRNHDKDGDEKSR